MSVRTTNFVLPSEQQMHHWKKIMIAARLAALKNNMDHVPVPYDFVDDRAAFEWWMLHCLKYTIVDGNVGLKVRQNQSWYPGVERSYAIDPKHFVF